MKRLYSILPALALCLLALLVFWRSGKAPEGGSAGEDKTAIRSKPVRGLADEAPMGYRPPVVNRKQADPLADLADVKLPPRTDLSWQEPVQELVFEDFRRWTDSLPAAAAGEGLQVGIELAQGRREALLRLIEKNPQRALELAVPYALRQRLPQEVAALLEQRVDGSGDLTAVATTLDGDRGCQIDRKVTLQDGQAFDAFTYGRRSAMPTRDHIAIHGVALDGKLALSEFPGRVLGPLEVAARLEAGQSIGESQEQTGTSDGPVIAFGDDRMIRYPDETQAVAALLLAEGEEQSGATAALASDLDGVIAYSPMTEGQKTLLIIRVDFTDYEGGSATDSQLQTLISDMNDAYKDMSSDKASFALNGQGSAITPVLRLPNTASYYNNFSRILTAARTAAAAAGYTHTNYTYEVVVTGAQPVVNGTAGVAYVGTRGAWLQNKSWDLRTCAHEIGHNFGLYHSGAWDTDDGSVIGPGEVSDYGNVFDFMGVGGGPHERRHFSASHKNYLDWVLDSDLVKITTNGTTTTRIRAMDKKQADGNKRALVVARDNSTDDYWIEHRQLYGTTNGLRDGVLVNWANINGGQQQPLLLDMTPSTSEKTDAVLPIGKTFSHAAAAIHITPVARGADADGVNWVDVTVTRGAVTGNASPTASISATNANPATNGSVTFTCTASDPNGDTLAYFWDWGNGTTTTTNSNVASKSWPTAGVYVVQCTVSDMKGLTTTANYVIQVGGTGFFIEGTVRTLQGAPLQGIVVTASPTTSKATTDATGRYIITGLSAGTYTLTASSVITDGFTNPVTVGPSLQDRNFTRQSYPLTWDANSGTGGAQDGGGTWANAGGNWHIASTGTNNVKWSNTTLDPATFGAGTDGTYAVALSGTVQAGGGISFVNSGYTLSGASLLLHDGTNNVPVSVAAGKTATINSAITYQNNQQAKLTADAGATLNLGGGASNSQYQFLGAGTINMKAGTYTANVGKMNAGTFNQSGGTFGMNLPSGNDGHYIGFAAGRSVSYTMSGSAIINANASGTANTNSFLAIGRGAGNTAYSNTLNVTGAANLNVGNAAGMAGELLIAYDNVSNGALNVTGGAATVGTGKTDNKIYFFKAGSGFGYTASLTQSGGTVTANGIQFGGTSGTYDAASTASLTLSGGVLYVGAQGITRGSAASDLPVAIKLQGGTLGANQNWSSSLEMLIGGTATMQAQDSDGAARNITLSGNLSDDGEVTGTLIKVGSGTLSLTGTNTFGGGLTIRNGTVESRTTQTTLGTGTVTMGGAGSTGATYLTGQNNSNRFVINAPDSGNIVIGTNNVYNGFTLSGGITLNNANLTFQTFNNVISGSSRASSNITGGVTGTGNLLLNNLGLAANTITISGSSVNHTGSITLSGTAATGDTTISAPIGANVTGITQSSTTSRLVLSGSNAYSGTTTISAGTLRLGAANVIPDGSGKGNVAVTGTFDLNGFSETVNGLTGSGIVDNTAISTSGTLTVTTSSVFNGVLRNSGAALALVKAGNSDFTLNGSNTYGGGTTINAGRLFIANPGSLTPNGAVQINNGGGLHLNVSGTPTYSQSITLASGGGLALRQAATLSNVTLPTSGSVVFNSDDQNTVGIGLNGNLALTGDLTIQVGGVRVGPGDVTLSGAISGTGGLVKTQTGNLILSSTSNTYSGDTAISAGTLRLGASNVIPNGSGKGNVAVAGTFDLNGFSETVNGLSGAGTVDNTAASTPATLTVSAGSTFSGTLQNSGANLALVKTGESDFIMSGTNTYRGGTTINAGRLFVNSSSSLTPFGSVQVNNTSTLVVNADGVPTFNQAITLASGGRLSMRKAATLSDVTLPTSGSVVFNSDDQNTVGIGLNKNLALSGTLTIQVGGAQGVPGDVTLSGTISGSGGLVKTQTGRLVLSATNSYSGPTTVSAGTLALPSGSIASAITVASGAKLGFTLGSTITSTAALTLSAGHSITISGTPTLETYTLFTTSSAISGTPQLTSAIEGYELQVVGDNELRLVQSATDPYAEWSSGAAFGADANGDGVSNGMAFLLGAADTSVNARSLLPSVSRSGGNLVLTFSMRNAASRGAATLSVQHSGDLGVSDAWTTVLVPDASGGPTDGVTFSVVGGDPLNGVTVTISSAEAANGKLFGRLIATQ
jgi:autotransporter-associated beta strand protein